MIVFLVAWTAGCGGDVPQPGLPPLRHGQGFDGLVAAAQRGELETVKVLARDFSMGDVAEGPEASALGASLGFLMVAQDTDDLADAIVVAQRACAECHARHGVVGL